MSEQTGASQTPAQVQVQQISEVELALKALQVFHSGMFEANVPATSCMIALGISAADLFASIASGTGESREALHAALERFASDIKMRADLAFDHYAKVRAQLEAAANDSATGANQEAANG